MDRDNIIYLRVTKAEKMQIQEYAASMGLSVAEYARRTMLKTSRARPFALLERALIAGIKDKDLETVKSVLADILLFLEDMRREGNDSNNKKSD